MTNPTNKLLIILIIFSSVFLNNRLYGQEQSSELILLNKNLYNILFEFNEYRNHESKSVIMMIKVTVDKKGNISDMDYSDNLDSVNTENFKKAFNNLNLNLFKAYFEKEKILDTEVLFPLLIYVRENGKTPTIDQTVFLNFSRFKGKLYSGKSILMSPVKMQIVTQHN